MIEIDDLINALERFIKPSKLIEAFEEANECSAKYVIFKFKILNAKFIEGVNIILRYLPHVSAITWGRVEVLISRNVPAKEFLSRIYNSLVKSKAEVIIRADGISAFYKLNLESAIKLRKDLTEKIRICSRIVEGIEDINLIYEGFTVLDYG